MDLYEFQGKELFRRFGIPVSEGRLATSPADARAAAEELGYPVVVKAQVLTGGRGKAGGIKLASTADEAEARAEEILGLDIRGHTVTKVWIERASDIEREYYLSLTFDRSAKQPLFMFTTQGGVDIEEVAASSPEALVRLHVDPLEGCQPWHGRRLVYDAGVEDPGEQKQIAAIVAKLYAAFVGCEALLCEINPLIVTPDGEVRALDSKFTVDENALFRHADIAEMRDVDAADPLEALAREKGVTYVRLDGEVGVLGNGAGLTMSTVDVVTFVGGRPADFCDLGGGGDAQGVVDALDVIVRDPQVRSIFFNIFGGITRCDEVARGHPAGARADGHRAADRRPPRRHECRGGAAAAERGGGRERADGGDDARRRAARGGAGGGLMAILVDTETRLVVQGLTGSEGRFHGLRNRSHGTQVVAGVTPGKGGQDVEGIPVFDTVAGAVRETGANTAMVFVPAPFAADAMYEAIDAGVGTVICITEGVPVHEMLRIHAYLRGRDVVLIGPNCPGALSPGKANVGIIPAEIFREGSVGLVSRSGTLTYQIGHELTQLGLGNSTIVGIGGDPVAGSTFVDILSRFEADPQTEQVVLVGEIGGDEEEKAGAFIENEMTKPVVAYIAGFTAPPGKTMGHAGAIISGSEGTAQAKKDALEARGIRVGTTPTETAELVAQLTSV